jgi:FG-GAP repeat protein
MPFHLTTFATFATAALLCLPALAQPCLQYQNKLIDPDGGTWNTLGWSAAVSVDVAIGGSPWDPSAANLAGSANIFRKVNGVWIPDEKLMPQDLEEGDIFGSSVALLPTVAVVGARWDDSVDTNAGAVYVFRYDGFSWVQEQILMPSDGNFNQSMGYSVSISGNRIVTGAPYDNDNGTNSGSAYIYHFDGSVWIEEAKLLPSDGAANSLFGWSVAISGPVAVVGAIGANWTGKVYVFRYDGSSWVEEADLIGNDTAQGDVFGKSVAAFGNRFIVGASEDDDNGTASGAAFIFQHDGFSWSQEAKLLPDDVGTPDRYGQTVSISGQVVAVGCTTGKAFVHYYDPQSGQWDQIAYRTGGPAFGEVVSVRNDTVIISDSFDSNINGPNAGALHAYILADNCRCRPDLTDDGVLDFFDVQAFLGAFAAGDPAADFNGDGLLDFFDVLEFLSLYSAGCP